MREREKALYLSSVRPKVPLQAFMPAVFRLWGWSMAIVENT